ncbi:MAG: protein kinase domain-containing protein [Bryobacteraceae bacterium]
MVNPKQFGPYAIIRKLGRGMTDVYLAFDTRSNRHVVLKIVEESADPLTQVIVEAERRGAALQRQLHEFDSRVIEVYEYGDLDGCFYLAMQHIEGSNIAEILRAEKQIDPLRAAKIAYEICSQLDRLHSYLADIDGQRRAVVHGDIKPSNIQIGLNDEVRLLDFGIAKAITFTHNRTHHTFGSPSYCSPERLSRAKVDHQADLWALGVTLYEMVAGSPPYQAETTRKLETLIQSRRPPRALPADCPTGLQAIITKALAGDLHQRYVSAAAFRDDLQLFLQNRPPYAQTESRVSWDTNATIEKPKSSTTALATIDRLAPKAVRMPRLTGALSLVGALLWGLLAGLLVFGSAAYMYRLWRQSAPLRANLDQTHRSIEDINSDWNLYSRLREHSRFLGDLSPVSAAAGKLHASYLAAGEEIIEHYRGSSDPALQDFDWQKAAVCLQHALSMEPRDRTAQGRLAVCKGYLALTQSSPDVNSAKQSFEKAASLTPRSPDAHLGLARILVYNEKNVGRAMAELHEARHLGYQPGPREMEEEADGYRFRAGQELEQARKLRGKSRDQESRLLQLAQRDFERARQLYEPILGYSNVSVALTQLDNDDRSSRQQPTVRHKRLKVAYRTRRWR